MIDNCIREMRNERKSIQIIESLKVAIIVADINKFRLR